ncbi:hypothetical protein D3C84_701880 [compost metagenome]
MLALDGALHQTVLQLHAGNRCQPPQLMEGLRPRNHPSRHIGQADMQDLAGTDGIIQRPMHLLHRRGEIPPVDHVQVDVIDIQAFQAGIQ